MLGRRQLREKVMQNIYAYKSSYNEGEESLAEKNLMKGIDQIYDLYIYLINLIKIQKEIAENKIELARKKNLPTKEDQNPNLKFINNRIFNILEANLELNRYSNLHKNVNWDIYDSYPNNIFKKLTSSELYINYMSSGEDSFNEDQDFILDFFTEFIAEYDDLHEWLEDIELNWADDLYIANTMAYNTIKSFRKNSDSLISFFKVYKDFDDKKFGEDLFRKTLLNREKITKLIEEKAKNWELDRIANIDLIIMQMAITEFLYFPNIPTKVTINEYVEISKNYSTEKSKIFINGILDKILKELEETNNLPKHGRGLL